MKFVWLTDIHLNFLDNDTRIKFYEKVNKAGGDAILISGDIAEAPSIKELLKEMSDYIKKPIYFVLGNHDYYKGKIDQVKNEMVLLTQEDEFLDWLPASGPSVLEEGIILVGQDGWADGRLGNYQNSRISLHDSRLIADLFQQKILGKDYLLKKMQELADIDAKQLQDNLKDAITQNPRKIIVVTHVPPFKETCLHEGEISDDDWLPYFGSKATGEVLQQIAKENPTIEFLVLCGHTHDECIYKALENLIVRTGKAEYYQPSIVDIIDLS